MEQNTEIKTFAEVCQSLGCSNELAKELVKSRAKGIEAERKYLV